MAKNSFIEINKIILGDCMDYMPLIPLLGRDVLAIVDPPYGINADGMDLGNGKKKYKVEKKWDSVPPDQSYFNNLFAISNNQIIWGGNYFIDKIKQNARCFLIWYKMHGAGVDFADCEFAWSSFDKVAKVYSQRPMNMDGGKTHPCQKPIALYRWLLQNYAKPGQLILDTYSGSGSCACACYLEGFDFIAIEKDPDYHAASVKRLDELKLQGRLFDPQ